jgi:ribosome recycling factor
MIDDVLLDAEERMDKAVEVARDDFGGIRAGRATPQMFQKITVDYYGVPTPIRDLASISIPEPRMAVVSPFDKSQLGVIERAIRDSDLGVNPGNDGSIIRISIPQLSEERRREFIKVAKHKAEEARVSIRNIRRKAKDELDRMAKDGDAGEDDVTRAEKELDKTTNSYVGKVDELLKHKEAELLEV